MQSTYLIATLLGLSLSGPVNARCTDDPVSAESVTPEIKYEVAAFLKTIHKAGDGYDAMFEGGLTRLSTQYDIPWWKVFGKTMAAEKVLKDLQNEDYVSAVGRVIQYKAMNILSQNEMIKGLGSANAIAGLAVIPIDLSLRKWAKMVNDEGVAFQKAAYRAARSYPFEYSHQEIMQMSKKDVQVLFDRSSGYLSHVGDLAAKSYRPFRPDALMDRDTFYEMLRLTFEAEKIRQHNIYQVKSALKQFELEMTIEHVSEDNEFPEGVRGQWFGYADAGERRFDYAWDINQSDNCVTGTISIKNSDDQDWSRYAFEGELSYDVLTWEGTSWETSRNGSFCMATGELKLAYSGGNLLLDGSWGPHNIRGGCPGGSGGAVSLMRE